MFSNNNLKIIFIIFLTKNLFSFPDIKSITIPYEEYVKLGDYFYLNKQYKNSLFYYEYIFKKNNQNLIDNNIKSKLLLNYIRLRENENYKFNQEYIKSLLLKEEKNSNFTNLYIELYSSFRFGFLPLGFQKINIILNSPFDSKQKNYAKLIFGSLYLEDNFLDAEKYYKNLLEEVQEEEIKQKIHKILQEIDSFYKNFDPKNSLLAGIFSGILPGTGYFYTHHYMDGMISLLWNSLFLGGGLYMNQLEKNAKKPHVASSIFLLFGLTFYISQIVGSYTSAIRYNNYKISLFYKELRKIYFNTDFIEKTSGIQFQHNF